MRRIFAVLLTCLMGMPLAFGSDSAWDTIKKGVGDAVDSVGDAAKSVTEEESPAETRAKIDSMEKATMQRLLSANSGAKKLLSRSFGYAVFDTRKFSFLITTGFGAGVAVEKASGQRTYMKMATGGANIGLGGEFFQLVILFENQAAFGNFIREGYEAGAAAAAVGGTEGASAEAHFNDGKAVYKLTEKGLKFAADITGTKYWKDDDLN